MDGSAAGGNERTRSSSTVTVVNEQASRQEGQWNGDQGQTSEQERCSSYVLPSCCSPCWCTGNGEEPGIKWPTSSEYTKRRSWRKLHIGFDAVTGRIVASLLTDRDVDDASQVEPLLDQIAEPIELFLGDGGYDRTNVYTALDEHHPDAKVIVPPRADAVLSATADTDPTQRDGHIQAIAEKGRMAWQRDSGYNQRAGVEGQFARWKQVIGNGLRFHSDEARATEVAIAAQVLNRMLDRPNSVRVA